MCDVEYSTAPVSPKDVFDAVVSFTTNGNAPSNNIFRPDLQGGLVSQLVQRMADQRK